MNKILPEAKFFFIGLLLFVVNGALAQWSFQENKGQHPDHVAFHAKIPGGDFYVENQAFTFDFHLIDSAKVDGDHGHAHIHGDPPSRKFAYKILFQNADGNDIIPYSAPLETRFNYLKGNNPENWASNVRAFPEIAYKDLYPGIDIVLRGRDNELKYDFVIAPGAHPERIKMKIDGFDGLKIIDNKIHLNHPEINIVENIPLSYQIIDGDTVQVKVNYTLSKEGLGFVVERYLPEYPLIIDPQLIFSTFSGSFSDNFGFTATYDNEGFLYGGGNVYGTQYPTTTGAYDLTFNNGDFDMAITKFDTTGTKLIYSTYIGGNDNEQPHSIVANEFGELFIMGTSGSANYPTTASAYSSVFRGGPATRTATGVSYPSGLDIVISKLSADGSQLLASTYLGGTENDGFNGRRQNSGTGSNLFPLTYNFADEFRGEIDINADGEVYIASCTFSTDFPKAGTPLQSNFTTGTGSEGIISIFNDDLSVLKYSTFIGGTGFDALHSIAIRENDVLFAGGSSSPTFAFPASAFTFQQNNGGGRSDGFFGSFDPNTGTLNFISFIGRGEYDQTYFIETDKEDFIYLFGQTEETSNYFSTGNPGYIDPAGGLFVTKFSSDGKNLLLSSTIGQGAGQPRISPTAFLIDNCQRIYISGWGSSIVSGSSKDTRFLPVTPDAFDGVSEDGEDQYLAVFAPDMASMVYATYLGDPNAQEHVDGGTSRFDKKGIVYQAVCAGCGGRSDFPTTPDAHSTTNNGRRPNGSETGCNLAVFKFDLEPPLVTADFSIPSPACQPSATFTFSNLSSPANEYKWDFGDGNTSTDKNPTHTYAEPGEYTVTLVANKPDACNISDTVKKTFPFVFGGTFEIKDTAICKGASLEIGPNLNGLEFSSYSWENNSDIGDPNELNPTVTPSTNQTYVLNGVIESCDVRYEYNVSVEQFEPNLSNDTTICGDNQSLLLQANTGNGIINSIAWSLLRDFLPVLSNDFNYNHPVTGDELLFAKWESDLCTYIDSIQIENVSISLPEDTVYCDETTLTLTLDFDAKIQSYKWSSNKNFTDQLNSNNLDRDIEVAPNETTTYFYRVITEDCILTDSVEVSPIAFAPLNDTIVCLGNLLELGFMVPDNFDFTWEDHPDIADNKDPNPQIFPTQNTTYRLTIDAGNGCILERELNVTVEDLRYDLTPDTLICDRENALILDVVAVLAQVEFTWSDKRDLSNKLNTGNNSSIAVQPDQGKYVYYIELKSTACQALDSVTVFVHEPVIQNLEDICQDSDSLELISDGLGRIDNFEWSKDRNFAVLENEDPQDSTILVKPEIETWFYIRTSTAYCQYVDSVLVRPFNYTLSPDTLLCEPSGNIVLSASGSRPNTKYFWSENLNFDPVLNGQAEGSITVPPSPETKYYYINLKNGICSDTDSVALVVHEPIEPTNIVNCYFRDSLELISDGLGFISSFQWSSASNFSDTLNQTVLDSIVKVSPRTNTTYYLRTKTDYCTYIDSVLVEPFIIEVSPDTLVCDLNTPVTFSASGNFANTNISWSDKEDFSNILNPGGNPEITVISGDQTDPYYVRLQSRGCDVIDSSRVLIHDPIDADEQVICNEIDSLELISNGYGKIQSFLFSKFRDFSDTLNDGPLDSTAIVNPPISSWYYIKTHSEFCSYIDSVFVKRLIPAPIKDTLVCDPNQPIILTADGNGVTLKFTWDTLRDFSSNPPLLPDPDDSSITVLPDASTRYYIKLAAINCNYFDSVDVYRINTGFELDTIPYCPEDGFPVTAVNDGLGNAFTWSTNRNFTDTLATDSTFLISADTAGKYYIRIETDYCEVIDSVSVSPFVLSELKDSVLCDGASILLGYDQVPFSDLVYKWDDHPDITDPTEKNPLVTPTSGTHTYWLTVSKPGLNCDVRVSQTITVSSLLDSISPSQIVCDTSLTTVLNGYSLISNNEIFTWSDKSDFSNVLNQNNESFISVKPTQSTTYYFKIENAECSAEDSVRLFIINPIEVSDTLLCNNIDSVDLTINGFGLIEEFQWAWNRNFNPLLKSSSIDSSISILPQKTSWIYFRGLTPFCEVIDSLEIRKFNNALVADTLVCDTSLPTILTATGDGPGTIFTWDTLADFSSNPPLPTIGSGESISVKPKKTTKYFVRVNTKYCTYEDSTTVFVLDNQLPDDTLIICQFGSPYTLIANTGGFANSVYWSENRNFNPILKSDSIFLVTPDTLTTYYIQINARSCQFIDSVSLSPFELPNLPDFDICPGDQVTLGPKDPSLYIHSTYRWRLDAPITPADEFNPNPVIAPDTTTIYKLFYAQKNCNTEMLQTVRVAYGGNILAYPDPYAVCDRSQPINLIANGHGSIDRWEWSENPSFTPLLNNSLQDSTVEYFLNNTSQTLYLRASSDAGCDFEETINLVDVGPDPAITAKSPFCLGDTLTLEVDPSSYSIAPQEIRWSPSQYIVDFPPVGASVLAKPLESTTITAVFTFSSGCIRQVSQKINPAPIYSYQPNIKVVDTIVFTSLPFTVINTNPSAFKTKWVPTGLDGDPFTIDQRYIADRDFKFIVLETTDGVCTRNDTLDLTHYYRDLICGPPNIFVPNAFSPNGDGENDRFRVRGRFIEKMLFRVYDRWGQMVFESRDQKISWDGTFRDEPLNPAVYVYYLEATCTGGMKYFTKGNVTLIR
ncbi:DUF7948 domain-containing protein [Luteibaculum oceani]|nr:gliding motility-associated C-terminal domain-containing protein [Luteibaculum oceani]